MKKSELKELYKMMFPEYPDIVTVTSFVRCWVSAGNLLMT